MQSIKVEFKNQKPNPKKPSAMPICVPFLVQEKDGYKHVVILTGSGAFIFFSEEGACSYTRENEKHWVDENFTVVEGEKATVTLNVE